MRDDIAAYLRSVGSLYPGGIPRALIGRNSAAPQVRQPEGERVLFLWLEEKAAGSGDAAQQLLHGAIEKGLKLRLSQARIVRSADPAALKAAYDSATASFVVLLGAAASQAVGQPVPEETALTRTPKGFQLLQTLDPGDILSDQARKKIFWSHLQLILKQL